MDAAHAFEREINPSAGTMGFDSTGKVRRVQAHYTADLVSLQLLGELFKPDGRLRLNRRFGGPF